MKLKIPKVFSLIFVSVLIMTSLKVSIFAEDNPKNVLTLSECINYAIKFNPNIKSSKQWERASKASLMGSKSSLFPSLTYYGGISRSSGKHKNSVENEYSSTDYSSNIYINQNIFNLASYKNIVYAKEQMISQKYSTKSTTQGVIFWATYAFYNALKIQKEIDIANENILSIRQFLNLSKELQHQGKCSEYDITFAKIDSMNAEIQLNTLKSNFQKAIAYLKEQIGASDLSISSLSGDILFHLYNVNLDDAINMALSNRPDYKASLYTIASKKVFVSLNYARLFPVLSMGGGANYYNRIDDYDYSNKGWNLGLNMSLPIFSGFRIKSDIDQAKASLSASEFYNENLKQRIIYEVQVRYYALQELERNFKISEKVVNESYKKYNLALSRYKSGKSNSLELSNAISSLTCAHINNLNYLIHYKSSVADLKWAIGIIE